MNQHVVLIQNYFLTTTNVALTCNKTAFAEAQLANYK